MNRTVFEDEEGASPSAQRTSPGEPDESTLRLFCGDEESVCQRLKRSVTIRLDESTVEYFRDLAAELELPYQSLINLYLRDCAASGRRLSMAWRPVRSAAASRP